MSVNKADAIAILTSADSQLAQLIEKGGDCPLLQPPRQTELVPEMAKAIISQQISSKAARTIYGKLQQLHPNGISAITLLETPEDTLRYYGISRPKIAYLKDLAQKVMDGFPTIEELDLLTDEDIIQTLTQIKGVGVWTAQMLLIFRLHRLDVFPLNDLGIRKGVQKLYNLPEVPNPTSLQEIGQKWKPYRSLACWYLWRSLG